MNKNITVENKNENPIRREGGTITELTVKKSQKHCVFNRLGTKFDIRVQKLTQDEYLVSIPNFFFSMTASQPFDIGYKLLEKQVMGTVDAESVDLVLEHLYRK
jgi:hypothetical protein